MRPYETQMPKIQMAGRDDTRAKGAKVHKETNYERYFSTPEKAAVQMERSSFLNCAYCKGKPECVELIERREFEKISKKDVRKMCARMAYAPCGGMKWGRKSCLHY